MTLVQKPTTCQIPRKSLDEKVTPDSTTPQQNVAYFNQGQEVLAKQKDGRYYLGIIVELDILREQCLVKYGDNTQHWSVFRNLTKLSTESEQEDLLCVICKKTSQKSDKLITVCDRCGRGYHKKCHQPEISTTSQKEDSTNWICKRCTDTKRLKKSDLKPPFRRDSKNSTGSSTQEIVPSSNTTPKVLFYDLISLNWDAYHRVNTEKIYCYCGTNGEWYRQMLQCWRCKQWFHEKCIERLHFPLYCGDRFYVFVCAICNHGKEFVRRLEIKWVDLVHLMLYNLTLHHSKKYHNLDSVVIPYISDNWHALQLPPKMANVTNLERCDQIMSILTNNRNRFKCARDNERRNTIWGLRVRLPPPAPEGDLPQSNKRITEVDLKELGQGNRRLQFLSPSSCNNGRKTVVCDEAMRNLMLGVAYQNANNHSDTESPCSSSEIDKEERVLALPSSTEFPYSQDQYLGQPEVRLIKCQLSKKDIIVKRNRKIESKKRLRRQQNQKVANYGVSHTASKTASIVPAKPGNSSQQLGNHVNYTLKTHARRLRQRPEKPRDRDKEQQALLTQPQTNPEQSPVKLEPEIDMDDLKSSVSTYFGAANRITKGEGYSVKATRIGPTGELECLIEWEGPGGLMQGTT